MYMFVDLHPVSARLNTLQSEHGGQRSLTSRLQECAARYYVAGEVKASLCFCLELQVRALLAFRPPFSD